MDIVHATEKREIQFHIQDKNKTGVFSDTELRMLMITILGTEIKSEREYSYLTGCHTSSNVYSFDLKENSVIIMSHTQSDVSLQT